MSRVTRSICRSKKENLHFGFFKESLPNFGHIHLKTPKSFLECHCLYQPRIPAFVNIYYLKLPLFLKPISNSLTIQQLMIAVVGSVLSSFMAQKVKNNNSSSQLFVFFGQSGRSWQSWRLQFKTAWSRPRNINKWR